MRRVRMVIAIATPLLALAANAQNQTGQGVATELEALPPDLEIELALSALPPHLRDNATVYALNPDKGFEVARSGTNGFHAFVARAGDDTFRGDWTLAEYRDDILYPISFDEAGAKAQMSIFFDAAEMQAQGTPPRELKQIMKERLQSGYYQAPERVGISYMLSPVLRTYVDPDKDDAVMTINNPHVMYYAPNISDEDIGGGPRDGQYPFLILNGPHGYIIQLLGVTETAAITQEYRGMLARLCDLKEVWCLPK